MGKLNKKRGNWLLILTAIIAVVVLLFETALKKLLQEEFLSEIKPEFLDFITMFLGFAAFIGFMIELFFKVIHSLDDLRNEIKKQNELFMVSSEIYDKLKMHISEKGNTKTFEKYADWILKRTKRIYIELAENIMLAPDPDYFGFAKTIFHLTQNNVISTSKVDPSWYDTDECNIYIQFQVDNIIKQKKSYERIFFYGSKIYPYSRQKLINVIDRQIDLGFNIYLVRTDNIGKEKDVAIIDNGNLAMEATVNAIINRSDPEIIGCLCYVKSIGGGSRADVELEKIKSYINGLKVKAGNNIFNKANKDFRKISLLINEET